MTQEVLHQIRERRDKDKQGLNDYLFNTGSLKDIDLTMLAECRGQVYALELVLDIEKLLEDKIEDRKDEEVQALGFDSVN